MIASLQLLGTRMRNECMIKPLFRYTLERTIDLSSVKGQVIFIMLNPSTADEINDDPTIRRCIGFAKSWGYTRLLVLNLYALRATNPKDLWLSADPVGEENDWYLEHFLTTNRTMVCAWGANAKLDRVDWFLNEAKQQNKKLHCLGVTKNGAPRHPLYIKRDQSLISFNNAGMELIE